METYNPARPNDYFEYKNWKRREAIERRERLAEERRVAERKRLRGDKDYSDSEYTESEDEERPRKNGMRATFGFMYFVLLRHSLARWDEGDEQYDYDAPSTTAPVDPSMTGDEAYARRLALSQGRTFQAASAAVEEPKPAPAPIAQSGEEAYLRRLAMSQGRAFVPNEVPPLPETISQLDAISEPTPLESFTHGSATSTSDAFHPSDVAQPGLPAPAVSTSSAGSGFDERVRSSREAAAAVAARLAKILPPEPEEESKEPAKEAEKSERYAIC